MKVSFPFSFLFSYLEFFVSAVRQLNSDTAFFFFPHLYRRRENLLFLFASAANKLSDLVPPLLVLCTKL